MQWMYWLIAIVLSAGAGYWVYTKDKKRAVPQPWLTALLRGLVVFFTLLLILVPAIVITKNITEKPVVLLLQDNSRSAGIALGIDSAAYRKNVENLTAKLSDKYKVVQWGFGNTIQNDSIFQYKQNATDIAAAIARAQDFFGMQNLGAVILATDGRFNEGVNPLYQQVSLHSPVYTVALGDSAMQKDIAVLRAYANKTVTLNSEFEIRADVIATLCNNYNGSIEVKEDGSTISSQPLSIHTDRYDHSVSFTLKATKTGLHHYIITVPVADGEKNTANNRRDVFVEVADQKKNILIVSASPHPDVNAIKEALSGLETYKLTICTADNFPSSLSEYQVIILHNLPSQRSNILPQVIASRKPVWFILGNQSNVHALNAAQDLTHVQLAMSGSTEAMASFNTAFNTFTLPQDIQSVIDKMPPLAVPAGNVQAKANSSILFTQRTNQGATQTPLWVLQQGSVPTAMLMGDGIWRWRLYEYKNFGKHDVVDECIRQTVSFLAVNNHDKPFTVALPKYVWSDQEAITLNAYLLNANNEQVNTPDAKFTITDSAGHKQNFSFEKSGYAYSLNLGIWAGGTYTYHATTTYNGVDYAANGTFAVESMPLELMESGADYPLLYGLAKKYNGSLVPAANVASLYDSITHNETIKPVIQTNSETAPLIDRKWYFFLILLVAVAEWLLRKYWLAQ